MDIASVARNVEPGRAIIGISAVLLPFDARGAVDYESLAHNIERTAKAGIAPAVNMDTGYANLISDDERRRVLSITREVLGDKNFVAGAFVEGRSGEVLALYQSAVEEIQGFGGTPILFQSSALKALDDRAKLALFRAVGNSCESFLAFELGEMFLPFGEIYSLEFARELMQIPSLAGMKHSSLNRVLEWQRLELRDEVRPDFKVYTGNDLAIDLVCYGSDYLLGLSAFCPEAFALRDKLWQDGDARFYGLNDLIQYLGFFAFRPPVPAYKHTCAQFLKLRGRIQSDNPHPRVMRRPDSDVEILRDISARLDEMTQEIEANQDVQSLKSGGEAL